MVDALAVSAEGPRAGGAVGQFAAVEELLEALREWGGLFGELGRRFGVHIGMFGSDASALVHIIAAEQRGAPLTQAVLSKKIGLSTGATSSLLNRLEEAGHVRRFRDSPDRRVVTIRATGEIQRRVDDFFATAGQELHAVVGDRDADRLSEFAALVRTMTVSLERRLLDIEG